MKTFFVDCETTGTVPGRHGLIQVAGSFYNDRAHVGDVNLLMRPFAEDVIEDEALKVNGRTREEIAGFADPLASYRSFAGRLGQIVNRYDSGDKIHFIGWNADFDEKFVRTWFETCGDGFFGSYFWFPIIDVSKLAGLRLMQERARLPNFRLMTVAQYLGVRTDDGDAHAADFDILVTRRIFKRLTKDLGLFRFETEDGE